MPNKREFKKYVDAVAASLVEEMMFAYYNIEKADREKLVAAVGMLIGAAEAARANSNITFDRGPKAFADRKEYTREKRKFSRALFSKVEGEFASAVNAAVKEFNAALPEEVKAAQKAAVN